MCRRCSRATRMAGRLSCRESARSHDAAFLCCQGSVSETDTSIFVSRGVGTVYVPIRINCPPEVALADASPTRPSLTNRRPSIVHASSSRIFTRFRIRAMLFREDARGQCLDRIGVEDRHGSLKDDRTAIELGVTRCTVTPATLTPCANAWLCASTPGNAGSSDG